MTATFGAIQKARSRIIILLEDLFYRWGRFVARRPLIVIIGSLLFTGIQVTSFFLIFLIDNFLKSRLTFISYLSFYQD